MREFDSMEERLDYIEFRQQLLFDNDDVSRLLFECEITRDEYTKIMDLMGEFRKKIENKESVNHAEFEEKIYSIAPSKFGDYHFCEYIAKAFMEDRRWEEVFFALYGDMPKYKN